MEFLTAAGSFLERALPVAQQVPELAPLMGEMLLYGVRAFKGGRPMEAAFDDAIAKLTAPKPPAQPQPDPEQVKMQGQMQIEQMRMQIEQAKMQGTGQLEQLKMEQAAQLEQFKAQQAIALEQIRQAGETQRAEMKANLDAQTKLTIAQMTSAQAIESGAAQQVGGVKEEVLSGINKLVSNFVAQIQDAMENQRAVTEQLANTMNAPREIVRGPDGRAIGVRINGVVREIQRGADGRAVGI